MAVEDQDDFDLDDDSVLGEATTATDARARLFAGVTVSDLGHLFHIERDAVRRRIGNLKPCGKSRRGSPCYHLHEAAPYLVRPVIDIEDYLKRMRPRDMPQALQKPFWDAQNGRLKFMEDAKHLWHTFKVQQVVAGLFKTVRQRIVLFADTVERQTSLTEEQRRIVQAMGDGLLDDIHRAIIEQFKNYDPESDRDEIFENGPPSSTIRSDGGGEEDDPFGGL